jgi:hypothetical protein
MHIVPHSLAAGQPLFTAYFQSLGRSKPHTSPVCLAIPRESLKSCTQVEANEAGASVIRVRHSHSALSTASPALLIG